MAWKFTKIKDWVLQKIHKLWSDPILTCHKKMNKFTEKYFSIHSFSFYEPHIWKKNIEDIIRINRFHSRDQYLDYRCYAAILVYLNGKQTSSVLRVEHGFVYDRWLWQQK